VRITDVLEKINEVLEPHLFPPTADGTDPRLCPHCGEGRLSMRTARSGGAFIGCSRYPDCKYTRPFGPPGMEEAGAIGPDGKYLGEDRGDAITLRKGRFGPYVQRGEATDEQPKPPRASLPKGWAVDEIDLEKALLLLSLPRQVGPHPEDGEPVEAGIGRYGPYVKHGRVYANLAEVDDVFTIGMNRAVEELAKKASRGRGRTAAAPLKELGEHPENGGAVQVMSGRYGPYVKWDKVNATLPKDVEPQDLTMDQAVQLIAEKSAKSGKKPAARKTAAKGKAAATGKAATKAKGAKPKTAKPKAAGKTATGAAKTRGKTGTDDAG
ncbi:MAG: topoisomerase C-terminal repeat-containing protein, partial [Tranquillimonas sp.]